MADLSPTDPRRVAVAAAVKAMQARMLAVAAVSHARGRGVRDKVAEHSLIRAERLFANAMRASDAEHGLSAAFVAQSRMFLRHRGACRNHEGTNS